MADASECILIVEDDPAMLRGLKDNFEFEGYRVRTAADGRKGLDEALGRRPDLIVLDIMLPLVNGYEICRAVRRDGLDMPIIMLTAKGQESDVVLGLNLGADDYVTKPFGINELLARARVLLRRRRQGQPEVLEFGPFRLDTTARRLLRGSKEIALTPKELALLELLARRPGQAMTRDAILRHVWGHNVLVTWRSVDRCVTTLRGKIEPDPARLRYIHTVRQIGYRFET
jgi:DNA-binding response OmpR family regulator